MGREPASELDPRRGRHPNFKVFAIAFGHELVEPTADGLGRGFWYVYLKHRFGVEVRSGAEGPGRNAPLVRL